MDAKIVDHVPAPLLLVTSSVDKEEMKVFKWVPFPLLVKSFKNMQGVLRWCLFTAVSVTGTMSIITAIVFAYFTLCSQLIPSWRAALQCPDLTPAEVADVLTFGEDYLWPTVPLALAAATTVGLLLPRRHARSRWCLAFLALVCAAVAHYEQCRGVISFIAHRRGGVSFSILGAGAPSSPSPQTFSA